MKRFLVEFAMGTDLHGQNVTKAACKAVRNAISNCCLCGISDCLLSPIFVSTGCVKIP